MAIQKLSFTKSWNNPQDFPAVETDETAVRSDMQRLHDEVRGFLNEVLIPALEGFGVERTVQYQDGAGRVKFLRLNADRVLEVSDDGTEWQATGSSGHVVLDASGAALPQRSRMRFLGGTVEDRDGVTVVTALKGDRGERGEQGIRGEKGETGAVGRTGPSVVPSVDANGVMHFTIQDTAIAPPSVSVRGPQGPQGVQGLQGIQGVPGIQGVQGVPGIQGPKGDRGDDGKAFAVKGMYATQAALESAHPSGTEGAAYLVGSENHCTVYIWDVDNGCWKNGGPLQGPQGVPGPQGVQGIQGVQGVSGVAGQDGKSAYQSAAEAGYTGTESAFNAAMAVVPNHMADRGNPHGVTAEQVGAAAAEHAHDGRYYTESEVDAKLAAKQDAATAIHTGNIAAQSVNYAAGAGYANSAGSAPANGGNADTVGGQTPAQMIAAAMAGAAVIETGSYTTTDTYGAAAPCTITFAKAPKLMVIHNQIMIDGRMDSAPGGSLGVFNCSIIPEDGAYHCVNTHQNTSAKDMMKRSGTTVQWYSETAAEQYNSHYNGTYYYIAFC